MSDCELIAAVKDELISVLRELAAIKAERDARYSIERIKGAMIVMAAYIHTDIRERVIREALSALDAERGEVVK